MSGLSIRGRIGGIAVAAMYASLFAFPQGSATSPAADAAGTYRIAGVLVNAATGEPVRSGLVQALDDGSRAVASSTTDVDGRFSLDHLSPAKYQLSASKHGFRIQSYDEHDEFASSIVTGPDQDTTHIKFMLVPNAVLFGAVTNDEGEPVQNARVMLFKRPKFPGTGERTTQVDSSTTDDTGAYEFGNLGPGEYLMAVAAEPWYAIHASGTAKRNNTLDVAYPITYFDSTTDEQAATPIELTGGMRQEADISLHAVPALRVAIPVPRKPDGSLARPELQQLVFGNAITAQSAGFFDAMETGSTEMGGIAPGQYELTQGDPPHVLDLSLSSSEEVDPASGSTANAFAGRLRMAMRAPTPEQMTIELQRIDTGPGQSQYAAEARQGRFQFDAVPPGRYVVSATAGDKSMPVVAISAEAATRAGNVITIRERTPEVVLNLSEAETRVEGFAAKEGKGCAGAMIVLLPRDPALWRALTRRDQSDSDGSFALRDVAPGEYTAIAIEDGWTLNWTSPAAMARYLPGGVNVTISANSGKLVRLGSPITVEPR